MVVNCEATKVGFGCLLCGTMLTLLLEGE